jgi:cobalt-zinc-cadmium efflux system protein
VLSRSGGGLNVRAALRHVAADALSQAGVMLAAVIILTTGWRLADPLAGLLIAVLVLASAVGIVRESVDVLMEAAPLGIDVERLGEMMCAVDGVVEVHDLHVWTVTSDLPALSAHVVIDDGCFHDGHAPGLLDEMQACLVGHFDVGHSTFQFEPASHTEHEHDAHA